MLVYFHVQSDQFRCRHRTVSPLTRFHFIPTKLSLFLGESIQKTSGHISADLALWLIGYLHESIIHCVGQWAVWDEERDRSHLSCLMEEKKDKDAKDFRLKPRPSAPRWRHPKVQVWASWSLLQLVFWWLPLRYWTGSLAGRGSRGGSRSPMEAGNQQTTLGKVAHNCFGHFFGPPQFSALSVQQIQKYEIFLFL